MRIKGNVHAYLAGLHVIECRKHLVTCPHFSKARNEASHRLMEARREYRRVLSDEGLGFYKRTEIPFYKSPAWLDGNRKKRRYEFNAACNEVYAGLVKAHRRGDRRDVAAYAAALFFVDRETAGETAGGIAILSRDAIVERCRELVEGERLGTLSAVEDGLLQAIRCSVGRHGPMPSWLREWQPEDEFEELEAGTSSFHKGRRW